MTTTSRAKYTVCLISGILAEIIGFFLTVQIGICGFVGSSDAPFIFPFASLSSKAPGVVQALSDLISMIQWPVYGWIVASGWTHGRLFRYCFALACTHIFASMIAYGVVSKTL